MERNIVEAFGRALRVARVERGLTQEKLAFISEMQRKHLGSIELGRKQPSLFTAYKLARGLSLTLTQLLAGMEFELDNGEAQNRPPPEDDQANKDYLPE